MFYYLYLKINGEGFYFKSASLMTIFTRIAQRDWERFKLQTELPPGFSDEYALLPEEL